MRQLFTTTALMALATSAALATDDDVIRLSEPVATTATHEVFGAVWEPPADPVPLAKLLADPGQHLGRVVVVETRIAKVCQKKGCFFVATDGAAAARVTFRDYAFFIPTDSAGKQVRLIGVLSRTELSAAKAAHYAADLGETSADASPPRVEYSIVASSVSIPREG